jgi:hypothetical protein
LIVMVLLCSLVCVPGSQLRFNFFSVQNPEFENHFAAARIVMRFPSQNLLVFLQFTAFYEMPPNLLNVVFLVLNHKAPIVSVPGCIRRSASSSRVSCTETSVPV